VSKYQKGSLDAFFDELGELEEVNMRALKRGIADAARAQMQRIGMSNASLAGMMNTSRAQLARVLDDDDAGITLDTLVRLAASLDLEAKVELRPRQAQAALREVLTHTAETLDFTVSASGYRVIACAPADVYEQVGGVIAA
jgi:antitoxin HicB